jgi:two-component system chemotaxis response regulator CheY
LKRRRRSGADELQVDTKQAGKKVRALVIDDSKALRAIVGKLVKGLGFEVFEAGNGREGLEQLKAKGAVDLSLVDWNMPDMNGIEFIRAVRAQEQYNEMKVMVITTQTEIDHVTKALESGANEYLMKPFTRDALLGKLQMLGIVNS